MGEAIKNFEYDALNGINYRPLKLVNKNKLSNLENQTQDDFYIDCLGVEHPIKQNLSIKKYFSGLMDNYSIGVHQY